MNEIEYQPAAWDALGGTHSPRQTLDLLGYDAPLQGLVDRYKAGRLHHAWLINGPRGIGKATMAYRFAEFILRYPDCELAPADFQFSDDAIHSQVAKGGHPNVLTLQRPWDQKAKKFKTRVTVDEVRKVASFLQTSSGANAWRIVIVDPADDLTTSAANALLKILEEPPARTLFFVLAHSPRGLLATIRSRCQVLPLKPLSDVNLKTILSKHELTADLSAEETNKLVVRAGGSARKAFELAVGGVVETFETFIGLVKGKQDDIAKVHQLAGTLTPAAKAAQYQLFTDMLNEHLAAELRNQAANDQVSLDALNRLVGVWERFQLNNSRAETWNMDKKQVVLNLYRDLRSA